MPCKLIWLRSILVILCISEASYSEDYVLSYYTVGVSTPLKTTTMTESRINPIRCFSNGSVTDIYDGKTLSAVANASSSLALSDNLFTLANQIDSQSTNLNTAAAALSQTQFTDTITLSGSSLPSSIRVAFNLSGSLTNFTLGSSGGNYVLFGVRNGFGLLDPGQNNFGGYQSVTSFHAPDQGTTVFGQMVVANIPLGPNGTYSFNAAAKSYLSGFVVAKYENDLNVGFAGLAYSDGSPINDRTFSFASGFPVAVPEMSSLVSLVLFCVGIAIYLLRGVYRVKAGVS